MSYKIQQGEENRRTYHSSTATKRKDTFNPNLKLYDVYKDDHIFLSTHFLTIFFTPVLFSTVQFALK